MKLKVFFTTKDDGIMEWKQFSGEKITADVLKNGALRVCEDGKAKAFFIKFLYYEIS